MAFHTFQKIQSDDLPLSRVQNNIEDTLQPIVDNYALDSHIIKQVKLTTGSVNKVNHLLGRVLEGWRLVRVRGQSTIWDTQDVNKSPHLHLFLNCSANVNVDIEVF